MRPDLNFDTLEDRPSQSLGFARACIFAGSILVMLTIVVALGARLLRSPQAGDGADASDSASQTALVRQDTASIASPQPLRLHPDESVLEPEQNQEPDPELVTAASQAILPTRPEAQSLDFEIRVVDGHTAHVELPPLLAEPNAEMEFVGPGERLPELDPFDQFLELEAAGLRSEEERLSPQAEAVLHDIEGQLNPLNPLDLEADGSALTNGAVSELDKEDNVAIGLVFTKPEGGDLRLKGKPVDLEPLKAKPISLPPLKPKALTKKEPESAPDPQSAVESNEPSEAKNEAKNEEDKPAFLGGLFKGLKKQKQGQGKTNIWDR